MEKDVRDIFNKLKMLGITGAICVQLKASRTYKRETLKGIRERIRRNPLCKQKTVIRNANISARIISSDTQAL